MVFFQPDLAYLLYIWVTKMLLGGRQGYFVPPLSYVRRMGSLSVMLPLSLYFLQPPPLQTANFAGFSALYQDQLR